MLTRLHRAAAWLDAWYWARPRRSRIVDSHVASVIAKLKANFGLRGPHMKKSKKRKILQWVLTGTIGISASLVVIMSWRGVRGTGLNDWTEKNLMTRGQFGDSFGELGALFAGLALVAASLAACFQWIAMRDEQASGAVEAIESRFFLLLGNLQTAINETRAGDNVGRQAIRKIEWGFVVEHANDRERPNAGPDLPAAERQADINKWFTKFYNGVRDEGKEIEVRYGDLIGHLFRLLYHILRFIDQSDIDQDEKDSYAKILRAHLANPELVLLFYNCLSEYGREKHYGLIEKYNMLKNMNLAGLGDNQNDMLLYPSLNKPVVAD